MLKFCMPVKSMLSDYDKKKTHVNALQNCYKEQLAAQH